MQCRHFKMAALHFFKKKTMLINIRQVVSTDFPSILALIKEFAIFQKTPEKVSITLAQMEKEKDFFRCFVAETNDQTIVGFASFYFTYFSWSGKGIFLDDLYVTESFRKQSIGVQLLTAVIDLGKKDQCKKLRWQVSGWNKNAIGFYEKMGAVIDDTEINCDLCL